MIIDVPEDKNLYCPRHGRVDRIEPIPYTAEGGVPGLHLRAACDCGRWVAPTWFVPRSLAGLEPRRAGDIR